MKAAPDQFEEYYRKAFTGYEEEPPPEVWEHIKSVLHSEEEKTARKHLFLIKWRNLGVRYKVASMVGLAIVMLLTGLYFTARSRHSIKGHAFAGESSLCRGTAVLFQVSDKTKPWDSVVYYRSSVVDEAGFYYFKWIEEGKYLLRIEPEAGSDHSKDFVSSWFDSHDEPGESQLIVVSEDVHKADVHLIEREGDRFN